MNISKTIKIFLMDGEPTQRIKCTLQNWTGIVYKIPRYLLELCREGDGDIVKHLRQTGVYFLLGKNDDTDRKSIYIGQAVLRKNGKGLLGRILEHKRSTTERYRDDWNEVIALTTQNDSFGATEIGYLENQFTLLAKAANRYDILNGNEPNLGNITEETESELTEYIELAKMIIGVLGHNVFEPIIKTDARQSAVPSQSPIFVYKGKLNAKGVLTGEGFAVLKGSQVSEKISSSARETTVKTRQTYQDKLTTDRLTTEDILFPSPSAAARFIGGCSLSGNVMWVTADGKTPKDF